LKQLSLGGGAAAYNRINVQLFLHENGLLMEK